MLELPFNSRQPINRRIKNAIKPTKFAVDIGAGIRPMTWIEHERLLCVEPYKEYCDVLVREGFQVLQSTALYYLEGGYPCDTIYLIDVIEHMEKEEGKVVIELAKEIASTQVILFTPLGFMVQDCDDDEADPWGMQGQKWQTHRSGWEPEEFVGWELFIDDNFHKRKRHIRKSHGAFAAIWNN